MSRFQFSMRSVLFATAVAAAATAMFTAEPTWLSVVAADFLAMLFASITILASLHTAGQLRAFWVGTTISAAFGGIAAIQVVDSIVYYALEYPHDSIEIVARSLRITLLIAWCIAPINGIVCVLVHWLFWPRPPESAP